MININDLTESASIVRVDPSDNIFAELGKNTYDYKGLLSELIDNALAARGMLKATINTSDFGGCYEIQRNARSR